MANQNSSKGNPASHRMSNPRRKARRAECWLRSQKRKERNRDANEERAAANRYARMIGDPTPHEAKKAKRRAKRDEMREKGELPPIGTTRAQWEKSRKKAA